MSIYMVDREAGNDSNDGRSEAKPWKTLARVSASRFVPGDQVQLRCGQVWKEKLIASSNGGATAPITYGAYGQGPHPVIDLLGTELRYPAIKISGKNFVTVKYIDVRNTTNVGILVDDSDHARIEGCVLLNTKNHGISVEGVSPACTVYNNACGFDSGFIHDGSFIHVNSPLAGGINVSHNYGNMAGLRGLSNGIFVIDVDNALIHDNDISGATEGIGVNALTRQVNKPQIYLNQVFDTNASHGDGEAIEITGSAGFKVSDAQVHHNLVQRSGAGGIDAVFTKDSSVWGNIFLGWANTAFHWTSQCTNIKFYNNLLWDCSYGFLLDSDCSAEIKNNILMACASRGIAGTVGKVLSEYNLFWKCGPNNIPMGKREMVADPLLMHYPPAAPGDCKLKLLSPAIHSGTVLEAAYAQLFDPNFLEFPYQLRTQSGVWSRGAFAY